MPCAKKWGGGQISSETSVFCSGLNFRITVSLLLLFWKKRCKSFFQSFRRQVYPLIKTEWQKQTRKGKSQVKDRVERNLQK